MRMGSAYTASKKRHGLLQAACTSMVKECSQNGVSCHDSYHVYHVRYLLIRIAEMLLACALSHVTQVNMQREVLFQRTRCLYDVLQHAMARARCPGATGYPRHAPYAALARPQQCREKKVLEQEIGENGPLGSKARGATTAPSWGCPEVLLGVCESAKEQSRHGFWFISRREI